MATRAGPARVGENANMPAAKDAGKQAAAGPEGRARRALGDIANVAGGVQTRSMKDKSAAGAAVKPTTSALALQPRRDPAAAAAVLRARATSGTAQKGGSSLSSLLQSRSEYAAAKRGAPPAAPPASPLPDIDSKDAHDPLAEASYAHDIYCYYRRVEPRFAVPCDYMASQAEINEKMRSILIDWLVEVHLKFKLMPETLYLTCNLIDRYLSKRNVTRKRLQLLSLLAPVGCTAMLIASKYEEIWAPEVRDFVYISDKAYSREDILACEKKMLEVLAYDLTVPTTFSFLSRFKKAAPCADPRAGLFAEYLIELALVDYSMLRHPLSLISAAALHAGLLAAGEGAGGGADGGGGAYPRALRRHARYEAAEVAPIARALLALAAKAPGGSLKAVYKKYSSSKFSEVAKMELPEIAEDGDEISS